MAAEVRERLVATAYLSQSGLGRDYSDARNCSGAGLPSYYRLGRDRADRSQDFMS